MTANIDMIKKVYENLDSIKSLKQREKLENDKEISEDDFHLANKQLQDEVDKANKDIEELAKAKEQDIMTV